MLLRRRKNLENNKEIVAENAAASSIATPDKAENTAEPKKRKSKSKE